jgi:hypothetical protein
MKRILFACLLPALAASASMNAAAQDRIYRCPGNEYTNNATIARDRGCKVVEGGNVTVVQGGSGVAPAAAPAASNAPVRSPAAAPASGNAPRIDSADQRARDGEARSILEGELRKAESRREQLLKEYNNGEPEKVGIESRNYQRYLDRVNEMKAQIARNDADIEGLKREISRLPVVR